MTTPGWSPQLLGQEAALHAALRMLRRGRVAHALLLAGPPGSGRGRLAEIVACAVVCADPGHDGLPCGRCGPCRRVLAGTHPDVRWVGPEGRLGIEEARALGRAAALAPQGGCSVFVVEACERLTGPAAGALLKVLEDPPGPTLFLLITEHPDQVEPTLRSRCLQLRLRPVPAPDIAAWLAAVRPEVPEDRRLRAAWACGGRPGEALRLCEADAGSEQAPDAQPGRLVATALLARTPGEVVAGAAALAAAGCTPEQALAVLRDAWVCALGLADRVACLAGVPEAVLLPLARAYPVERAGAVGEAAWEAQAAREANVQAAPNWQVLLTRLRRLRNAC
jgi:DNA polymerase-3 subunit delta'